MYIAKVKVAEAISSSVYSCLEVSRGKPRTPITIIESPEPSTTRDGVSGIETLIPNRERMASIVAECDGLQQDSTSCATNALTSSTGSVRRVTLQSPTNMLSASAKPKNFFMISFFSDQKMSLAQRSSHVRPPSSC